MSKERKSLEEKEIEAKEREEALNISNAKIYKKPVKEKTTERIIQVKDGEKIKTILERTYSNGVVKRTLQGITKNGKKI